MSIDRGTGCCPEGLVRCFSVCLGFFILIFYFLCKGVYKGGGQIWRNREMSGTGAHDVKFSKNQSMGKLCFKGDLKKMLHIKYHSRFLGKNKSTMV